MGGMGWGGVGIITNLAAGPGPDNYTGQTFLLPTSEYGWDGVGWSGDNNKPGTRLGRLSFLPTSCHRWDRRSDDLGDCNPATRDSVTVLHAISLTTACLTVQPEECLLSPLVYCGFCIQAFFHCVSRGNRITFSLFDGQG